MNPVLSHFLSLWSVLRSLAAPTEGERLALVLARFPPPACTAGARAFADRHHEWTQGRLYSATQDDACEHNAWTREAFLHAWCWQYLDWAQQAHGRGEWRACRHWLGQLEGALPPGYYWQGRMPAVAPLGRFREIR